MKKIIVTLITLMTVIQLAPSIVKAEGSMAYSVKANIPENQINKTLTYFDLKMEPNQKQEVTLTVSNSSNEEATILISPNVAITNQNGVIDYSQSDKERDSSLKVSLEDVISEEQEVTLLPNETKEVNFLLQMSEKSFEGIILGGFYISKKDGDMGEQNTEQAVQIQNNYSYVIGIKLRQNLEEVKPDLKLNQIKPSLINYRTAVTANLQNTEATIINNLDVEAKITKKGEPDFLREVATSNLSMAPNSNFDFPISWDNQRLEPGDYTLNLVAKSGEAEWKFTKDFAITADKSRSLNNDAVELANKELNWLIIGTVLFLILFILLALIFKRKVSLLKKNQD